MKKFFSPLFYYFLIYFSIYQIYKYLSEDDFFVCTATAAAVVDDDDGGHWAEVKIFLIQEEEKIMIMKMRLKYM